MADQTKNGLSESPEGGGPALKLDARELLEFITRHTEADRSSFDRLLKWFGLAAGSLVAVAGAAAAFLSIQNKREVDTTAAKIRQDARNQIQAEVAKETSQQNIQKYIAEAIERKTESQFNEAIGTAVAAQLGAPERQKFLQAAVQRQVDLWFTTPAGLTDSGATAGGHLDRTSTKQGTHSRAGRRRGYSNCQERTCPSRTYKTCQGVSR